MGFLTDHGERIWVETIDHFLCLCISVSSVQLEEVSAALLTH